MLVAVTSQFVMQTPVDRCTVVQRENHSLSSPITHTHTNTHTHARTHAHMGPRTRTHTSSRPSGLGPVYSQLKSRLGEVQDCLGLGAVGCLVLSTIGGIPLVSQARPGGVCVRWLRKVKTTARFNGATLVHYCLQSCTFCWQKSLMHAL